MIAPRTTIGQRPHRVTLQNPERPVSDGDGGFTQEWTDLVSLSVEIAPASHEDLERLAAGTTIATATHVVTGPFYPGVTTRTRVVFGAREFGVLAVLDPGERHVEIILICAELTA